MRQWTLELKVGFVIALACIFFVFLLLNAADWQWGGGGRTFKIRFEFVNDIQEGALVYLSGVPIGKVRRLLLTPEGAVLEIGVSDEDQPLREGSTASISMLGLVGESVLLIHNGPTDAEPLPDGAIIQGKDPVNVMETINELGRVVTLSAQTIQQVQNTIRQQDEQLTQLIRDVQGLTRRTQVTLDETSRSTNQLLQTLNTTIGERDQQLVELLSDLKQWLYRTQEDSSRLMAQLERTSSQISELVDANQDKVQTTLDDFATAAESLRTLALQVGEHSTLVERQVNSLLANTQDWVAETRPGMRQLIAGLQQNSEQIEPLIASLQQLSVSFEQGDGSLPKLLHDGHTLDVVEHTLQEAQAALAEVRHLTQTVSKKTSPNLKLGWDYELRYRATAEQLHNEANLILNSPASWDYRLGMTERAGELGVNALVGYRYRAMQVRVGLIHSETALGIDYALLSDRLRFTLEGTELTTSEPRFMAEIGLQPIPHWEILLGTESSIRDSWPDEDWELHLGIRLGY